MEEFPLEMYMEQRLEQRRQELFLRVNQRSHLGNQPIPIINNRPKSSLRRKNKRKANTHCNLTSVLYKPPKNHLFSKDEDKENYVMSLKNQLTNVNKKLEKLNAKFTKNQYKYSYTNE